VVSLVQTPNRQSPPQVNSGIFFLKIYAKHNLNNTPALRSSNFFQISKKVYDPEFAIFKGGLFIQFFYLPFNIYNVFFDQPFRFLGPFRFYHLEYLLMKLEKMFF